MPCGPQPCHRGILKVLQIDSRKWFQHVSTRMKTSVNWDHHPKVGLKIKILKPARKVLMEKTDHSPISAHLFQPLLWTALRNGLLFVRWGVVSNHLIPRPQVVTAVATTLQLRTLGMMRQTIYCNIFCIYNYILLQYIYIYIL